ncbi:unnamed protein product [Parajaminaea phylloscopi]
MITFKGLAKENDSVNCSGERALVSGGTQGIGAGIALRFALSGASVWIIGRSEDKAHAVLDQLRLASAEARRRQGKSASGDDGHGHDFFQADLSKVEDIKRVADLIASRAGTEGIDYLIETQGGPPTGKLRPPASPASPEGGFAVQCLSRFGLAYLLTEQKIIKRGVCWVAAPATGSKKPLDVSDLDLTQAKSRGQFTEGLLGILPQGQRDSSVLDATSQVMAERNPHLAFTHLFPGIVGTDAAKNQGFAWPLVQGSRLLKFLGISSSPSPGGYPEVPFYLHANANGGQQYLRRGEANLLGPGLKRYEISPNVRDGGVRQQVWDKMTSYFRE